MRQLMKHEIIIYNIVIRETLFSQRQKHSYNSAYRKQITHLTGIQIGLIVV